MDGGLPHGRNGRTDVGTAVTAPADRSAFIAANTALIAPPHVPELRLHLADEAHELWHKTEEELQAEGLEPPFWAFAWAGGQGLARMLLDRPELVAGKRVFDFATGSGLVAIAAAMAGAARVTANDIDAFSATAVALNADANGVRVRFDGADRIGDPLTGFDVVTAGDVFYDRAMSTAITGWFSALALSGKTVLVGDPGRHYLPRERLLEIAVHEVAVTRALEDTEVRRTVVWQFI